MRDRKKWFWLLFGQRIIVALLVILQLAFLLQLILSTSRKFKWIGYALTAVSMVVALSIIHNKKKPMFKLTWVFLILTFPVFGGLFYLIFRYQTSAAIFRRRLHQIERAALPDFFSEGSCLDDACKAAPECAPQLRYLEKYAGFPVYLNSSAEYLPTGEAFFERLIEQLKKAEKYIFLEYFIIEEGKMWDAILEVLKEKAAQGVTVRLIYDDVGCFFLLPREYPQQLKEYGIETMVFNPFVPTLTVLQNNRDHRKIACIDGKAAFTGGINLADEYINAIDKHGHWKDSAVMIQGGAAWSFAVIFLQTWELCSKQSADYEAFYPWNGGAPERTERGMAQPYADSPLDDENVSEHVYLQMITGAKSYVYITTPYLIVDSSMTSALTLAAKSGVDVRIVTPYRWDKWLVHVTTRSYYRELISAGVKIYEYSKGFMHAKTFVSDDKYATVGTVNLDFRSLYLHFECGVWLHELDAVNAVRDDFISTLEVCKPITLEDCKENAFIRVTQDILRLFAPLM